MAQNPKCQNPGCDKKGKLHDAVDSNDTSQTLWLYICDQCWDHIEDCETGDVQKPWLQVHLVPAQGRQLGGSQTMAVRLHFHATPEPALSFAEAEAAAQTRLERVGPSETQDRNPVRSARRHWRCRRRDSASGNSVGHRPDRHGDPWKKRCPPIRPWERGRAGSSRSGLPGAHGQTERPPRRGVGEAASPVTRAVGLAGGKGRLVARSMS